MPHTLVCRGSLLSPGAASGHQKVGPSCSAGGRRSPQGRVARVSPLCGISAEQVDQQAPKLQTESVDLSSRKHWDEGSLGICQFQRTKATPRVSEITLSVKHICAHDCACKWPTRMHMHTRVDVRHLCTHARTCMF